MKIKIKEILKERKMTQKDLANLIGMSEAGLSGAINGSATKETIKKIALALSIEECEIIENETLFAKYSSDKTPLIIGSVELPCYVLNNGMRVFSGRGIQKALCANNKTSGTWLINFVNSKPILWNLRPEVVEQFNSPIEFNRVGAGGSQSMTYGYEATLLIDLCNAIIDAFDARTDSISEVYYKSAKTIVRAVAKVGIIALVDEATGYNKEKNRAKDELQRFLSSFINQEAGKWVKTFDDTFFEDIYKMRGWSWSQTTARPALIGKIINDIVYERIAPLVYDELKRLNPRQVGGGRRYKHHQFLTSETGKPALAKHLAILHSFAMAAEYRWERFMYMLDKAYPKQHQQLAILDDYFFDEDARK